MAVGIRTFHLLRSEDASGVSGTGVVAEGVEFSSGWVAMTWFTKYRSINIYENIKEVEAVHGHEGRTKVVFDDIKEVK